MTPPAVEARARPLFSVADVAADTVARRSGHNYWDSVCHGPLSPGDYDFSLLLSMISTCLDGHCCVSHGMSIVYSDVASIPVGMLRGIVASTWIVASRFPRPAYHWIHESLFDAPYPYRYT